MRTLARWIVVALLLSLTPLVASAAAPAASAWPTPRGTTTTGVTSFKGDQYPYRLYTPPSYRPGAPLVVVAHGCQTTAAQEEQITGFDQLADRNGFVVLYPEDDAVSQHLPGPIKQCFKFFFPQVYFRGFADTAAIAQMTRSVIKQKQIDAQRVYLVGVSGGGLITSASAGAYPDLYAAVGIVESAGDADGFCLGTGTGIPVQVSAALARIAMGPRARVVPLFVMGSTGDLAFPAACEEKALQQGLRTDNLVISGSQTTPISLRPASVRNGKVPGGRSYTLSTFRDPNGCLIGQQTITDGMPHAWPGGSPDPQWKGYSDPTAPSGAKTAWDFFRHFTLSGTAMPCATAGS
ncbi:MAG TPA: PHB depolymerase family esterase [Mycobacteriales bacterium]|nr:PHB depolymerase family esterase [Mycobacteriales bacterium]